MIHRRAFLANSAAAGVLAGVPAIGSAAASDYPNAPVKIIIAQAAGGSLDVLLRIIAEHLGRAWGMQPVILNMPAGSGVVAARAAIAAAPDGYTLFMASASAFTVLPETQPSLAAEIADLVPIGLAGEQPMAIVTAPDLGASSLPDLIARSQKEPGGLNCAVGGRNSLAHLTGELFRVRSGANLNFVYYAGASQALNDVVSGRVPVFINVLAGIAGAIAGNQVKLLSITSPERLPTFPEIPAAREVVRDFVVSGWIALVGPRGTPDAVVKKVNDDLRAIQARAELRQQLEKLGAYTRPLPPRQVADFIEGEQKLWRPLVRELGVKASR